MPGIYSAAAGVGSGGGLYSNRVASTGPVAAKSHHGVIGFVENLAGDVGSSILGLPAGLVQTVEHPIKTAEQVGKVYKQTYGPLLHGDVSKFLHGLYAHPLGPLLDAATVVTLGAGLGARVGILSSKAEQLALRSPAVLAGQEGKTIIGKVTSRNPAIRARQTMIHEALNKLPPTLPIVGEYSRYGRELDRLPRQVALRLRNSPEARAYGKAVRNLDNEEFVALHLIGRGIKNPADYKQFLAEQAKGSVEPTMLKVLENPRVASLVAAPDAKLTKAVDAATAFSELDAKVKIDRGLLTQDEATARVNKHAQTLYGEVATGRFYVPDVNHAARIANSELARMGGGKGVARLPGSVKQNQSVLFHTGQLALHPDLLSPTFLSTIKYGLFDDIHTELEASAVRLTREQIQAHGVPQGWELLRKKIIGKSGRPRPQKVSSSTTTKGISVRQAEQVLPPEERVYEGFTVKDLASTQTLHGDYLIVPSRLVRQVSGEFTRSNSVIRQFIDKPTKVWRALVLGFRIGFLTNNVIGNHLLYAIHAAGVDGLRAYLNAVKRVHGQGMVRTLLSDREIPEALRQQFMDEFFPEQSSAATFGRTQVPEPGKRLQGKKGRKVRGATVGILPATQAVAETTLRRGLVETFIRKSPEFRKVYRAMPREARDFEAAAKQILDGEGGHLFQRTISDKVDHALGNYLNLSDVERNTIRAVVPFYSWYRAIATITTHLALDTPGRANLLSKIGQVGAEATKQALGNVPDYLLGLLPIGGPDAAGKQTVLSTGGLNPFQTIPQLMQGAGGVLAGSPGETGKAFAQLGPNPFLLGLIENLAGKDLFTGKDLKQGPVPGVLGQTVGGVATQLPFSQLYAAATGHGRVSKLYGKQSAREALLQFLGAPVKQLQTAQR